MTKDTSSPALTLRILREICSDPGLELRCPLPDPTELLLGSLSAEIGLFDFLTNVHFKALENPIRRSSFDVFSDFLCQTYGIEAVKGPNPREGDVDAQPSQLGLHSPWELPMK